MKYHIRYSCVSHRGKLRSMNQDNFICCGQYMGKDEENPKFPLTGSAAGKTTPVFGIFDGMGGEECGEIASYIAAKKAGELVIGKDVIGDISRYCLETNREICGYVQEHGLTSMGTTAAMLVFTESGIVLCNIGDSKIFRFSQKEMEQISQDHVGISVYGKKPPLTQNLGIPEEEMVLEPYMARGQCTHDDLYLICSDGLTDMLEEEEISTILADTEFDNIAQVLLDRALDNGGRDNITIILCKMQRDMGWLNRMMKRQKKEVLHNGK